MAEPIPLEDFLLKMEGVLEKLPNMMLDALDANALSARDLIQARIQDTGIGDDGVAFEAYTADYLAYKEAQGKYKGFVDFTLSSDLWSSINIVESGFSDTLIVVRVTAVDDANKKKLEGLMYGDPKRNIKGRGNFLTLAENEVELVTKAVTDQFVQSVQNFFAI